MHQDKLDYFVSGTPGIAICNGSRIDNDYDQIKLATMTITKQQKTLYNKLKYAQVSCWISGMESVRKSPLKVQKDDGKEVWDDIIAIDVSKSSSIGIPDIKMFKDVTVPNLQAVRVSQRPKLLADINEEWMISVLSRSKVRVISIEFYAIEDSFLTDSAVSSAMQNIAIQEQNRHKR